VRLERALVLDFGLKDGEREESIRVGEQGSWLPHSTLCPEARSMLQDFKPKACVFSLMKACIRFVIPVPIVPWRRAIY